MRTLESRCRVSSDVIVWAVRRMPNARLTRSCRVSWLSRIEKVAGLPLVIDQYRHHIGHFLGQFLFGLTERDLIADLVEIASCLRIPRRTSRGPPD